jgi:type IV secretory pathway protease TraF
MTERPFVLPVTDEDTRCLLAHFIRRRFASGWKGGETRGYLRKGALLIKPVAAGAGDTVCRDGPRVTINGRNVAHASTLDAVGRPLPAWFGCFRLAADDVFVLSADPDSFDPIGA